MAFRLIRASADVDGGGNKFKTPLYAAMAAPSIDVDIVEVLLQKQKNLSSYDRLTGYIVGWAIRNDHARVIDLIMTRVGWEFSRTYEWTRENTVSYTFGEHDVLGPFNPKTYRTHQGSYWVHGTAPYLAAHYGRYNILQKFLPHWKVIDETDFSGRTALYWAVFNRHTDMTRLLLEHGADPHVTVNSYGWNPLHWAIYNQDRQIEDLLRVAGAHEINFEIVAMPNRMH